MDVRPHGYASVCLCAPALVAVVPPTPCVTESSHRGCECRAWSLELGGQGLRPASSTSGLCPLAFLSLSFPI